jgi:hypothetical protein
MQSTKNKAQIFLDSLKAVGHDHELRALVGRHFKDLGVVVNEDAPVSFGGFSWVIKVKYGGEDCALVISKGVAPDVEYRERIAIREKLSSLFPNNPDLQICRVKKVVQHPVPACFMNYIEGDNCDTRAFDTNGRNIDNQESARVFRVLGEFAANFSAVRAPRFGSIVAPKFESGSEYLRSYLDPIERMLATSLKDQFSRYGVALSDLERIVDWVIGDAQTQKVAYLMHGDLSPWNLIHDSVHNHWSITDGDDAKFGLFGEQIGVCLNSMRGNLSRPWIDAILDGYGASSEEDRRALLQRGAAYGVVTYGLNNFAHPWDSTKAEMCREIAVLFLKPCVQLFRECSEGR